MLHACITWMSGMWRAERAACYAMLELLCCWRLGRACAPHECWPPNCNCLNPSSITKQREHIGRAHWRRAMVACLGDGRLETTCRQEGRGRVWRLRHRAGGAGMVNRQISLTHSCHNMLHSHAPHACRRAKKQEHPPHSCLPRVGKETIGSAAQ